MSKRFFKPFVGSKYAKGINGKKILVLGASFYCNKDGKEGRYKCRFFDECTSPVWKDSSRFDSICPAYAENGLRLSEEPSNAIAENYKTYQVFANFMRQFINDKEEDVWQRMAFTDYVQFFLPTIDTKKEYLSQRDFDAFIETMVELKPHVVVAWGMAIIDEVRERNPYVTDFERLKETEWYVCHMQVPQVPHEIALVCSYHPSSVSYWYNDLDTLTKYIKAVLYTKNKE
mgnify:CR=1 FL=1